MELKTSRVNAEQLTEGMVVSEGLYHFTVQKEENGSVCECCANSEAIHTKCRDTIWKDQDIDDDPYLYLRALEESRWNKMTLNYELHLTAGNNYINRLIVVLDVISSRGIRLSTLLDKDGGTALHTALKRNQTEAAKLLIAKGGKSLILQLFENEKKFRGTSCLHLAVVNGNRVLVDEMMERLNAEERKTFLHTQADGEIFQTKLRFSGLPLSLSILGGVTDLFECLVRYGAEVDKRDSITGNTVMHTIIEYSVRNPATAKTLMDEVLNSDAALEWWSKKKGFYVTGLNKTEVGRFQRYILQIKNFDGYTPLTFAAKRGMAEMLVHTLEKEGVYKFTRWIYGYYSMANYDMSEVDSIAAGKQNPAVTDLMVYVGNDAVLPAFDCPPIRQLIHAKWKGTRLLFAMWFIYHCAVMSTLTAMAVNRPSGVNATYSSFQSIRDFGLWYFCGEILVLLTAAIYFLLEVGRFYHILHRLCMRCRHKNDSPFFNSPIKLILRFDAFRLVALSFSCSAICRTIMEIKMIPSMDIPLSIALVTGWYFVLFFTRIIETSSFFTLMIHRMLFGDLLRFATVFLVLLFGFSTSMKTLYLGTGEQIPYEFSTLLESLLSMFRLLMGLDDIKVLNKARSPEAATIFYLLFICIAAILLLNMLIAAMSDTYANMALNSHSLFLKYRLLTIMQFMDNLKCSYFTKRMMSKYMVYHVHEGRWELEVDIV